MAPDHYFSETPNSSFKPKEIEIQIGAKRLSMFTAGGTFSPDRLDAGTDVLLQHLSEAPRGGDILDIGCGWGPITIALALHCPKATIWAVDINERSLELTRRNAERHGLTNVRVCKADEVPADLKFSGIWSNPPIRIGKAQLHELLLTWLPRLRTKGQAMLVVQKNLGADSLHRWLEAELEDGFSTERIDTAKSYRVLRTTAK
jgi:16S rRNA G1207 methylase RsmC